MSCRTFGYGAGPIALFGLLVGIGQAGCSTGCSAGCSAPSRHTQSGPAARAPAPADAGAQPTCLQPEFRATPEGVAVTIGQHTYPFAVREVLGEHAYNYTRRTVGLRLIDKASLPGNTGDIAIETSCYTETDCTAPKDPQGHNLWCLVSHTCLANPFFPLFQRHRLCPSPLEFMERLVT